MLADNHNQSKMLGRVLVVAGSDPSGGAGIQADIKTITMLGQYAATAITAITIQNTQGVSGVEPVPESVISGQIDAVLSDIGADALKTGMLHSKGVIETVCDALENAEYAGWLVVDPVMVATSGDRLLNEDAMDALKGRLLPKASVLTPNIPEAEALTGMAITDVDGMRAAGKAMLGMGAQAVVLKGGHLSGDKVTDICLQPDGEILVENDKIDSRHTHGTGCTLASAIAAGLSDGQSLETAFKRATEFVHQAIVKAPMLGEGNGPLGHAKVKLND